MSPASFNFAAVFAHQARERSLADREESAGTRNATSRKNDVRRERETERGEQSASEQQN